MVDGVVSIANEPADKRQRAATPETVQTSAWTTGMGFNKTERLHNVNDGTFSTNRRGVGLRTAFSAGTCIVIMGQNCCAVDPSEIHQGSKWLSIEHLAATCTKSPGPRHLNLPGFQTKESQKAQENQG